MNRVVLAVDGHSLMYRAFYALPPMQNRMGEHTNSIYGFFSMLFSAIEKLSPDHLVIAFDKEGKVFRHETFDAYKAGRKETPAELVTQFPLLKDTLDKMGVKYIECQGFEADDILGTLSAKCEENGDDIYLLTGDRDTYQLVGKHTKVFLTKKGVSENLLVDEAELMSIYGLQPDQMTDLKGLMGDASDNIPGVKGVGEKTALKLLGQYQTIDGVYDHIDEIKGALKEKLIKDKDNAFMSKEIGTIVRDLDCVQAIDTYVMPIFSRENVEPAFERLEFKALLKRIVGEPSKPMVKIEKITVSDMDALDRMIETIEKAGIVGIYAADEWCFAIEDTQEYTLVMEHSLLNVGFGLSMVLDHMKRMFEDASIEKVVYDAKELKHRLHEFNISLEGLVFDTKLAEYVIDPTARSFEIDAIAKKYDYHATAALLIKILEDQRTRIKDNNLNEILDDIEMPLLDVLFDMEVIGFKADKAMLKQLKIEYDAKIESVTKRIYDAAGADDFNINSTKQLGEVLFERLGLPIQKKTKTGYSTDIKVLEKLEGKHPIISEIILYRKLTKLSSTYIEGLLNILDHDDKIHSTFNQISTATGRISSTDPNLQNIPIRTEEGREIRKVFIPSLPEGVLVAADYSQIELRVLASIANDENMIDAFNKNQDIHARTASQVFGVPIEDVSSKLRSDAKAVNFGIVYGISGFGLARNLGIAVPRATAYIEKYLEEFSGIAEYMQNIKASAKKLGYVKTMQGRVRYIHELSSSNFNIRSFGERAALNTPIQGTAADIIKVAMIKVYEEIEKRGLKSKLILQVHDELIVDAVKEEADEIAFMLKNIMENVVQLKVPLVANVSIGHSWYEAK